MPLFSIITVSFNSSKTIERSIKSLQSQNINPDLYEHIFIDGNSSDNTLEIIKRLSRAGDSIVSEKDNGIYDAMNKGIKMAKGGWIYFLNSDDMLYSDSVLFAVKKKIEEHKAAELIYGKVAYIRDNGTTRRLAGLPITQDKYWNPMLCICHQGLFVKKDIFNKIGFFKLGIKGGIADRIWLIDYFHKCPGEVVFFDEIIASFNAGGYYENHAFEAEFENAKYAIKNLSLREALLSLMPLPRVFIEFKILKTHKDTWYRRLYRKIRMHLDK